MKSIECQYEPGTGRIKKFVQDLAPLGRRWDLVRRAFEYGDNAPRGEDSGLWVPLEGVQAHRTWVWFAGRRYVVPTRRATT